MATERELRLAATDYEDDVSSIHALRVPDDGWSYLDPVLVDEVANLIRQYPNQNAVSWLAPVAAILAVERRLLAAGAASGGPEQP